MEHLVFLLNTLDFRQISRKMADYATTFRDEITRKWVQVLDATLVKRDT